MKTSEKNQDSVVVCAECQKVSSRRLQEWVLFLNGKTPRSVHGRFCSSRCASRYFGEEVE